MGNSSYVFTRYGSRSQQDERMNPENLFGVGVGRMVGFPYLFSLQSAVLQESGYFVDIIYAEGVSQSRHSFHP